MRTSAKQVSEYPEYLDPPRYSSERGSDPGGADLDFDRVVAEEEQLIAARARLLGGALSADADGFGGELGGEPFSIALSGGGMRAAAFQMGALWRLAEKGVLQDVQYICAVSGGAYVGAALASHLIDETALPQPEKRRCAGGSEEINKWYLRIIARSMLQMQANIGYIMRDPWYKGENPSINSGYCWRICDVPFFLFVVMGTVMVNPGTFVFMYLVPITEAINMFFGAAMRAAFCTTSGDVMPNGQFWRQLNYTCADFSSYMCHQHGAETEGCSAHGSNCGQSAYSTAEYMSGLEACGVCGGGIDGWSVFLKWSPFYAFSAGLLFFLLCSFVIWLFSQSGRCSSDNTTCYLLTKGLLAGLTRFSSATLIVLVIIGGLTGIQKAAYGADSLGMCRDYVSETHAEPRCADYYFGDTPNVEHFPWWNDTIFGCLHKGSSNLTACVESSGSDFDAHSVDGVFGFFAPVQSIALFVRRVGILVLSASGGLLLVMLGSAALLMPFYSSVLRISMFVIGPFTALLLVAGFIQYRIFGPITHQPLVQSLNLWPFYMDHWINFVWWSMFTALIVVMPLYQTVQSSFHGYYCRCLRQGFCHRGLDRTWKEVRDCHALPFMIFPATVNDYKRPGDKLALSEITFSSLHTGGDRTGYIQTPDISSLVTSTALSAAASDAFVLERKHGKRYRFYLEVLNLRMGDYILFERKDSMWGCWSKVVRFFPWLWSKIWTYAGEKKIQNEASLLMYRMPSILLFFVLFVLLIVGVRLSYHASRAQCWIAKQFVTYAIRGWVMMIFASFFGFLRPLEFLMHSMGIRKIHMATQYCHRAQQPPSMLYVTDGGIIDCTGILQLLRRRCSRILLILACADPDDEFGVLRTAMDLAVDHRLASFYDPKDPRRDWRLLLEDYKRDTAAEYFHIGIRYGWTREHEATGHLIIVKNRLPPHLEGAMCKPLLTEKEIIGEERPSSLDASSSTFRNVKQSSLAGCMCDCCHLNMCNQGPRFPHITNANQVLTPQHFNCLCRLGHHITGSGIDKITSPGSLEEPWEKDI